jgi:N-acetylmuramoyl-L-alanine amidase
MATSRIKSRHPADTVLVWLGVAMMALCLAIGQWNARFDRTVSSSAKLQPFGVVVIDPGHGGQDSGATVGGVAEKDLTLDLAQRVDRLLQEAGIATVMTRMDDTYISLAERVAIANRISACILVSLHFNEGNKPVSNGIETYYADHQVAPGGRIFSWLPFLEKASGQEPNVESQNLASSVQEALIARTSAFNRGTKAEQYFVIANVRHPAVLVEGGFLSNKEDSQKLTSADYREKMAVAISEGILRYRDALRQRQTTLAVSGLATGE